MKRILNVARSVIVSLEFLAVIAGVSLFLWQPEFLTPVGVWLRTFKTPAIVTAEGIVVGCAITSARALLFPATDDEVLAKFPDYPLMRDSCVICLLVYCVVPAALICITPLLPSYINETQAAAIFLTSVSTQLIYIFSNIWGGFTIRSIIAGER